MTAVVKTIREISIGVFDGPHATPELHDDGAAVFLGIPNLLPDGRIDVTAARWVAERDLAKWTRRVTPQPNDIVFTYEATLNRYAIIPEGFMCCLGRRTALIRPEPSQIDHRFLFYYFFSPRWRAQIEANTLTGATVDRIPLTTFPEFEVLVPELQEQKRIAEVLSAYDDLIATNQRRIALLEDAARRLYREWFVHLRFPGHESVPVKDGVPEGWRAAPLDEALVLQRGFDLPSGDRVAGDIPIVASTGINGFHNVAKVKGPGVVTGRSGTLGTVHYVPQDFWPLNTSLWVKEFRAVSPQLAYFILSDLHLEQLNSGASVPTLDRKVAHQLPVLIPVAAVAADFDLRIQPLFDQIHTLKAYNETTARARDLLLPKLMSGQLDVSGIRLPEVAA